VGARPSGERKGILGTRLSTKSTNPQLTPNLLDGLVPGAIDSQVPDGMLVLSGCIVNCVCMLYSSIIDEQCLALQILACVLQDSTLLTHK